MNDKVTELRSAIDRHVRAGMTIHIGLQAGAGCCEVARRFWDTEAEFTLVMNMIGGHHALSLIQGGLVKKLVFSVAVDIYPRPTPLPVIQRAYRDRTCHLENWSMLALTQALMAGALNLPFMPTRSLVGSSMEQENQHAFRVIQDVFEENDPVGLVKAMKPDLSIVHGWAADSKGNTILSGPPRDAWAAKASSQGIIVCAEKIVDESFIQDHSMLVKIPGHLVRAVCEVPFGAHPQNMCAQGLPEFDGYEFDREFLNDFRRAAESADTFDQWVDEWVLGCQSHRDYLNKLGEDRLEGLKESARVGPLRNQATERQGTLAPSRRDTQATSAEKAILSGARVIKDLVLTNRYKTIFAGIGISGLAGWCAYYMLKEDGYSIDLIGTGIGYQPCPGDPLLMSSANMATAKMISDSLDQHGVCVGGTNSRCLGVLGVAQIDKYGNMNSTVIRSRKGEDVYLSGAGGGNDIASAAQEVVAVMVHRANRMVKDLRYVTCPGARVKTLVTDQGLFVKRRGEFVLSAYLADPDGGGEAEAVEGIARVCEWGMVRAQELVTLPWPTAGELALVRSFDPENIFLS